MWKSGEGIATGGVYAVSENRTHYLVNYSCKLTQVLHVFTSFLFTLITVYTPEVKARLRLSLKGKKEVTEW